VNGKQRLSARAISRYFLRKMKSVTKSAIAPAREVP